MRIYIIGNDGITLCREPPAVVSEGEIVVASNEELHAARLSGKRLLARRRYPIVECLVGGNPKLPSRQLWRTVEMGGELTIRGCVWMTLQRRFRTFVFG